MGKQVTNDTNRKLDVMIGLLQHLVAIELWKGGVAQAEIGNRLDISAGSANKFVKGVKRNA